MDEELDIGEIAHYIKQRYTELYRARGVEYARCVFGTRWEVYWRKAAALCLHHGLDPDVHIRALLNEKPFPQPYQLLGDWAVERTKKFMATQIGSELIYAQSQMTHLGNWLRGGEKIEKVLLNPNADLTDSFRYCIARKLELFEIASKFREHARLELRMNPERLQVLRRLLPDAFMEAGNGTKSGTTPVVNNTSGTGC